MRTVNTDWGFAGTGDAFQPQSGPAAGERTQLPVRRPAAAGSCCQGSRITTVREDIRAVQVIEPRGGRHPSGSGENRRRHPRWAAAGSGFPCHRLATCRSGWRTRCFAVATARRPSPSAEMLRRTCSRRMISTALMKPLQPIIDSLPPGYRIETAGSIEESGKATRAMVPLFPIMIALTLLIIILQVRSLSAMVAGFPDRAAGADWRGPDAAAVQSAVWHQCPGGPDRPVGDPDAQYADPDWPNPS